MHQILPPSITATCAAKRTFSLSETDSIASAMPGMCDVSVDMATRAPDSASDGVRGMFVINRLEVRSHSVRPVTQVTPGREGGREREREREPLFKTRAHLFIARSEEGPVQRSLEFIVVCNIVRRCQLPRCRARHSTLNML